MEAMLQFSAAAIRELCESLEEESLSAITVEGGVASFSVTGDDGQQHAFTATFSGNALPAPAVLACTSGGARGLARANARLAGGANLSRAVAAAGRAVGVDLDWTTEAEGDGGGSDEEMADVDSQGGHSEGEGDEDELLREWSKRLVKVEKIERAIEEREESEEAQGNLDALQQRQIFDARAAFRRLANELEEVFKAQDFNMMAEVADEPDGLYRWHVTLGGFSPDSPLAKDMQQAGRLYGSSSVQLQLLFKRPLHPFYPPSVQLVSPRFQGPILSAVASHPVFSIQAWDFTRSAREALLLLKAFLEEHARVDFGSARNSTHSAYLPVEVLLAKLEALTGTEAAAQSMQQYQEMYQMRAAQATAPTAAACPSQPAGPSAPAATPAAMAAATAAGAGGAHPPASKKQRSAAAPAAAWKAGVGYGHRGSDSSGQVWDAKKAEAVQAARDRELGDVLEQLARELTANLADTATPEDKADCTAAVSNSCLAPFLAHQLAAASFQDMAARHAFYHSLLQCAEALCSSPVTAQLLAWHSPGSARTVASAVAGMESQVSHFVRVFNQAAAARGSQGAGGSSGGGDSAEDQREMDLATYLLAVAARVAEAAPPPDASAGGGGGGAGARPSGEGGAGGAEVSAEEQYRLTLSPYRVRMVPGVSANHSFRALAAAEAMQPKLRARRVGRELASCESDLPVSASSSVFVVADEACSNLWKALITGPENTPYCGGCFLFDIYFPPDYPRVPPKVLIRTTGGGTVRFNPNLYNEGKVCLSLLGTWQGGRGESWSPDFSTVLQVLISIQSLILVDEPFYNEPGYEQRPDDSKSHQYSAHLMPSTVKWAMLDQLQHPPEYFRSVIHQHFRLRGDFILENCRRWVAWCRDKGQAGYGRQVEVALPALEAEIARVKQLPAPAAA